MKKLLAIMTAVIVLCSVLTGTAFAATTVISPEKSNLEPDPQPTAPQTGYENGIAGVAVIALASGVVAVVSVKKARQYRS